MWSQQRRMEQRHRRGAHLEPQALVEAEHGVHVANWNGNVIEDAMDTDYALVTFTARRSAPLRTPSAARRAPW